jgi:hypothetical protein
MHVSDVTRALSATAVVALLAGCSGGTSALSPSGVSQSGPTAQAAARKAALKGKTVSPFASKQATALMANHRPIVNLSSRGFSPIDMKKSKGGFVFASDNYTGNVDVYDPTTGAMVSQCAGCGGWGVAVSHKGELAIGTFDSTVTVWTVSASAITQIATCNQSSGSADGVAWDSKGNLYGDNFPSNGIDTWSASSISGGCGSPSSTVYTTNLLAVYYLGTQGKTLLADGYTDNDDVDLVSVNKSTGNDTILQTDGNLSQGTGFPGGIAVGTHKAVYLNNQYGTINEYSNGGKGSLVATCNWGFDPNDYTGISVGKSGGIWGADINFGSGLYTYAEEDALPLGGGSCNVLVDSSPEEVSEEYLGVAVYPANK